VSNFNDPEYFDIWQLGVTGFTECNSIVAVNYTPSPQNQGARIIDLTQRPLAGPTHLTGGVSPLGCMSSNRHIYQIQNLVFCAEDRRLGLPHYPLNSQFFDPTTSGTVSGTLRVRITTQRGLNVDPFSEVTLQDEIGTTPVHYSTVNSILPYGTGTITEGGQWEFYFSLSALASTLGSSSYDNLKAFMDNSIFNFPLTPCCTGKNVPAYSLEWEINPYNTPDARGCSSCWIPLARSEGSIHLMCPGCVTPGVIVQDVSINRTTAGWPDHDNDGLADAGSVPYTSVSAMHTDPDAYSLAGKSYMPGDELSSDIFAYGVDGDNTNHGFDYATLMAGWSLSTPVDHFDYLNISITDPCMANWTTTNATIEIQFPGASSFVLSSSSLLTYLNLSSSTPTNQIYNIPYSAFPAGSSYTQYHINDEYKVHFDYRVCVNGPAGDCDHQVVMWWSITPHGLSSILSVPQAGIPNEALSPPPLYLPAITPAGRVAALPHDLRYFCE
jgi:hypothetical protein